METKYFPIQSNRIRITNKLHFNNPNKNRDTICGKMFSYPDSGTDPIEYDGKNPKCLILYLKSLHK